MLSLTSRLPVRIILKPTGEPDAPLESFIHRL